MTHCRMTAAVIAVVLAGAPLCAAQSAQLPEQATSGSKLRVGTFDSRCLAMAYYASELFKGHKLRLQAEYEKAKAAGDKKRLEELEARGQMMHKQAFSTWPVDNIVERIKKEIPEIAQQADVDLIISKWDLVYHRSGVEIVDITPLMVKLLVRDEEALKAALEIQQQTPIPRETRTDAYE